MDEFFKHLMPEWKDLILETQILTGGITNRLYRVRTSKGEEYVVRHYGDKTELFINRDVEMENLQRMEVCGVTPKLIKYLPDKRITIVEYIPGLPLKNQDFMNERFWELIVRPIKIVNRSRVVLPFVFHPKVEVKRLYKILEGMNLNYPEFDLKGTINILVKIDEIAQIPHSQYVPCHNDLLADNFILVSDEGKYKEPMYLIDWEYAGMGTPYYDLADMFQEILVPREIEENILRIYWEDENMNYNIYMTNLFKPFPDIYWFLWSLIQLNISSIEFDYYNYGKIKYENAKKNIKYLREYYNLEL